jgi:dihydrofolate reductase
LPQSVQPIFVQTKKMRKLKLQMAFSADGWDDQMDNFCLDNLKNVDCILLGRKTAEGFIPHWAGVANNSANGDYTDSDRKLGKPLTDIPKVVFSNTIKTSKWDNATVMDGNIEEQIKTLKKQKGKDIIVYGGYSFVLSLMEYGLIDEYYFLLNPLAPVTVEGEQAILKKLKDNSHFRLKECKPFAGGVVSLCYKPEERCPGDKFSAASMQIKKPSL